MRRPAAARRAAQTRRSDYSKQFLKDWKRLSRSGRYDMHCLKEAMWLIIANDGPLGPEWLDHALKGEWLDHALKGDWVGHRECHIGGDFLLAYKVDDSGKVGEVIFVRAGTHAELFSE